jgi:phage-related protein
MPVSQVVAYQESDGTIPFLEWLAAESAKVQLKTVAALRKLEQFGYELHRPHADYLRDDIYELRFKDGRRNIRVLYFFAGRNIVVLSHGLAKTDVVPPREIDLAIRRRQRFLASTAAHTASFTIENEGSEHEED